LHHSVYWSDQYIFYREKDKLPPKKKWGNFSIFRKSQSRQETAVLRWLGFGSAADLQPKPPTSEQENMKKVVKFLL
jgi:hypothetical protein